jgi:hypothetical protein
MAAQLEATHLSTLDEVGPQWMELCVGFDAADHEVAFWERALAVSESKFARNEREQAKARRERARCSMVRFLDKLDLA